jgi:hypothetical protein
MIGLMEALQADHPEIVAMRQLPAQQARLVLKSLPAPSQSFACTAGNSAGKRGIVQAVHFQMVTEEPCDFDGFMACAVNCSVTYGLAAWACYAAAVVPPAMVACFLAIMVGDTACIYACAHSACPAHF